MHGMHIQAMDLNLAVVLHVLLEERNVSRAAKRLRLSQSATSHALARLRTLLEDPLFVRTPTGLAPTGRAEAMADALASSLSTLESTLLARPAFDPTTAQRTFHLGSSDYAELVLMPSLLMQIAKRAPRMDVWNRSSPEDLTTALAQGELDLVIGPERKDRISGLHSLPLWEDRFVIVVRRGHPLAQGKLTLERFVEARHGFVAPRGRPGGAVDEALAKKGLTRRIAFTTPNFLVAPQVVAKTDLVITLASRIATAFARTLPLVCLPPPLELPGFRIAMFWHDRRHGDPAHVFLREEVTRAAGALPPIAPARRPRRV